ncbi:uncharacterized protein LOC127705160 [Mytilus californianus]|uniref:uncharacterized protein LOC127705160 n=1 Tax=Mytilus californianus TaxID=6549 RepID=UPI0022468F94|nr:uncharacterized protein LOC127705160 [Mytilus californianus]XP_052065376.1 uncharacterized protein LOC127705160 [Mytilus californianus]
MPKKKRASIGRQRKKHNTNSSKSNTSSSDVKVPGDIIIYARKCIYIRENDEPFWRLPWLDIQNDTECKQRWESDEVADSDGIFGHEFYVILDKPYKYHHTVNLEDFTRNLVSGVIYSRLKTQLDNSKHPEFMYMSTSRYIRYIQCYDSDNPKVKMSVTIMPDLRAEIHVHGLKLDRNHKIWNDLPLICLTKKSLWTLLDWLKKYRVCAGNFDPEFQDFFPIGRRSKVNGSNYVAFREDDYSATTGHITYHGTIRSTKCLLLTDILRCKDCAVYRRTLKKTLERETHKPPVSQVNWLRSKKGEVRMTEVEKLQKLKQYKQYTHELETKCNPNPNVKQFNQSMVNIHVAGSQAIAPLAENTKRQQQDQQISDQPLPKRPRQ